MTTLGASLPLSPRPAHRRPSAPDTTLGQMAHAMVVMAVLLVPICLSPVAGFLSTLLCGAAAFAFAMLYTVACVKLGDQQDMSGFLLVPLLISALQNVYLGLLAPYTFGFFIQLALMSHIVFALTLLAGYYLARPHGPVHPLLPQLLLVVGGILVFAAVSVVALHASVLAMISSARNMLAPFLFLMLGLLLAERVKLATYLTLISLLAWLVLAFGVVEYVGSRTVWTQLNIAELWPKKGIGNLASWGMPANFVSSEKFFGQQVRRMVSSYADPVNFGTVLFLFFMVAWYTRRWALLLACLVCIGLAISKGAVLGLLIFGAVLAWRSGNRLFFAMAAVLLLMVGIGIVAYTLTHSTQSVVAHVRGLSTALQTLPDYPLGRGLGRAGVLAIDKGSLKESGLGLIIGQLGVLAFVLFGVFFWGIWRWVSRLADPRQNILARTLFLALFANIAFNEVALSPNSSAGYFMVLGLLMARDWLDRRAEAQAAGAVPKTAQQRRR